MRSRSSYSSFFLRGFLLLAVVVLRLSIDFILVASFSSGMATEKLDSSFRSLDFESWTWFSFSSSALLGTGLNFFGCGASRYTGQGEGGCDVSEVREVSFSRAGSRPTSGFLAPLLGSGVIISHTGSEGLAGVAGDDSMGDSELDMGERGASIELSQVDADRGEKDGVEGSVSTYVSKDMPDSGGGDIIGDADMGVMGGELGVIWTGGGIDENRWGRCER